MCQTTHCYVLTTACAALLTTSHQVLTAQSEAAEITPPAPLTHWEAVTGRSRGDMVKVKHKSLPRASQQVCGTGRCTAGRRTPGR